MDQIEIEPLPTFAQLLEKGEILMGSAFETEQEALTSNRQAVLVVVSSLRKYRAAAKKILESRYSDGECDAYALHKFSCEIEEAEEDLAAFDP